MSTASSVRHAVRHAYLTFRGLTAHPPQRAGIKFLYGHSMTTDDRANFRGILRLLRNSFEFVSFTEAVRLLRERQPLGGRYVCFSFDDGYRDNYELVAPELTRMGASACFFLTTNFIDCDESYRVRFLARAVQQPPDRHPMTWSMVRQLANAGFEFGAHTMDHPDLGAVDVDAARHQIDGSARAIEAQLQSRCRWFAWPYGRAQHFPVSLLPYVRERFDGTFSAIRSREQLSYNGAVINRDHFEPGWPESHVRYFAFRQMKRTS